MKSMFQTNLTPTSLLKQIKEIEVHCQLLREEAEKARRHRRKLNKTNSLYDKVAYHTFQIAIHNDIVRTGLVKTNSTPPTTLANGTKLAW